MKLFGAMIATVLVSVFLLLVSVFATAQELSDTQSMSFTKNIIVKQYKRGQVEAETHKVKDKDTLWSILIRGYGIKERQFFFFCRMTKSLNPDLEDADHLVPDQLLLIPYKYISHFTVPEGTLRPLVPSLLASQADTIPTEEYTFSEGEHLAQVLRDLYNIPDDLIFDDYLDIVEKLNPEMDDVNLVRPGQTIRLPSASAYQAAARKDDNLPGGIRQEQAAQAGPYPSAGVTDEKAPAGGTAQVFSHSVPTQVPPYLPSRREGYMSALGSLTGVFKGTMRRLGDVSIPIVEGSRVTVDSARFPVIQFTPGKSIIVDYGGELPGGIVDLVELKPGNYEVVTLKGQEPMRSVLDKLFAAAGYFEVDKSKQPLIVGGEVQYQVVGDWIIYADEMIRDIMVVNLVEQGDVPLDLRIKESLKRLGVSFVELLVGEHEQSADAGTSGSTSGQPEVVPVVNVRTSPELVDAVLDRLGQTYTRNHTLQLPDDALQGSAAAVSVDRYFEKEGVRHIVCFHPVDGKMKELLEGQGCRVLGMNERIDDPIASIKTVLDFMQIPSEYPCPEFYDSPGDKRRVTLIVPGVLARHGTAGEMLFTASVLSPDFYDWLLDNRIRVFQVNLQG